MADTNQLVHTPERGSAHTLRDGIRGIWMWSHGKVTELSGFQKVQVAVLSTVALCSCLAHLEQPGKILMKFRPKHSVLQRGPNRRLTRSEELCPAPARRQESYLWVHFLLWLWARLLFIGLFVLFFFLHTFEGTVQIRATSILIIPFWCTLRNRFCWIFHNSQSQIM